MDTMLKHLSESLAKDNIRFSIENQQIRCLIHIVNLAAQQILQGIQENNDEEDEDILSSSVIKKVK